MARPALEAAEAWESVAARLAERLGGEAHGPRLDVDRIEPLEGAWALGAVDGGAAVVVEGGGLAVGAVRAAALAWRPHAPVLELPAPLEVELLDAHLAARLDAALPGLPPAEGPAQLLERWRALREWEQAMALAARLAAGDALLLDGSLAPREWPAARRDALAAACAARGVLLAGFCKSTSWTLAGMPALVAAARAARGVAAPWSAALPAPRGGPRAVAARFHAIGRVFKVEFPAGADPGELLGRLVPWTRDAGYVGYPYPLALAHNRCALDEALVEDLGHRLRSGLARRGVPAAVWEEAFGDFHEVLDRGL